MENNIFKDIVKNYSSSIQGIIKNITGKINEDIEQEVYIKAWKDFNNYQEKGSFSSWIKTITTNACKDYFRSKYFKQSQQTSSEDNVVHWIKDKKTNVDLIIEREERQKLVIQAIEALKPKYKEIIILFEIRELQYEEISKKLNCPVGTVKSRLFKARKLLQEELKELI